MRSVDLDSNGVHSALRDHIYVRVHLQDERERLFLLEQLVVGRCLLRMEDVFYGWPMR